MYHITGMLIKHLHFYVTAASAETIYLARESLAGSNPVIIPNKVMNRPYTTLFAIISGSLPAKFLRENYSFNRFLFCHCNAVTFIEKYPYLCIIIVVYD